MHDDIGAASQSREAGLSETDQLSREGRVIAVRGSVIDIRFPKGGLPDLNEALAIDGPKGELIAEVQAHLDEMTVRAVSMQSSDGPLVKLIQTSGAGQPA